MVGDHHYPDDLVGGVNMNKQEAAKILIRGAEIRENSFDTVEKRYKLNCQDACAQAAKEISIDEELGHILGLALDGWWNDALDWAARQS